MIAHALAVWIAFRRGRGPLICLLAIGGIWLIFRFLLGLEGVVSTGGESLPVSGEFRMSVAIGFGLRAGAAFGLLLVLFQGAQLILGDAFRGAAAFDLSAPVRRETYLIGRGVGFVLVLSVFWLLLLAVFEGEFLMRSGRFRAELFFAAAIIVAAQMLVAGLLVLLRPLLGRGWGALLTIVVVAASAFIALDPLEAYLFDVGPPPGGDMAGGWWYHAFEPWLAGEPVGMGATVARMTARYFPPAGNMVSVAFDIAARKPVWPHIDGASVTVGVIWCFMFWAVAVVIFRRKDL